MKRPWMAICIVLGASLALAACGGGSTGTYGVGTIVVTSISGPLPPNAAPFTLTGGDFSNAVGTAAVIRFEAQGTDTPFEGGTKSTAEIAGIVTSATTVDGVSPPVVVCGVVSLDTFVTVLLVSGVSGTSATPIATFLAPSLSGLSGGGTYPSAIPTAFTLTGTGLAPVGGTVLVRWTASTPIFQSGASSQVQTTGIITSTTQITGVSPMARVCGSASESAVIDEVAFPGGSCTGPALSLPVTFLAPTLAALENVQAGSPWNGSADFAAAIPETFRVTGTGFGPVGGTAQVSWSTPGTSSFLGGTSQAVLVSGTIVSDTQITGVSPDARVCDPGGLTPVDLQATLPGGSCTPTAASLGDLHAPTTTALDNVAAPGTLFPALYPMTFRLTGTDFGPNGGSAFVTFTSTAPAPADTPFLGGTSADVTVTATIIDRTTIEGTSPTAVLSPALDAGTGTNCVSLDAAFDVTTTLGQGSCTPPPDVTGTLVGPLMTDAGGPPPHGVPSTVLLGQSTAEAFTVSGAGFGPIGGTAQVTFSDTTGGTPFNGAASVTVPASIVDIATITGTLPTITTPRLAADVDVRTLVALPDGSSTYCNNAVRFVAPPTITTTANNRAPFVPGAPATSVLDTWLACVATSTTVTGTGFHSALTELFYDQAVGTSKPIGGGVLATDPAPGGAARSVTPPTTLSGWSPTDTTLTSPTTVTLRLLNPDQQFHEKAGLTWETTGALPNVNASQQAGTEAEMAMCVNPTNPLNAAICAHDGSSGFRRMFFSFTLDGGRTWATRQIGPPGSAADDLQGATGFRFDPMISADAFGNIYAIYGVDNGTDRRIIAAQSADGGNTFPNIFTFAFPLSTGLDRWTSATGPDGATAGNQALYVGLVDFATSDIRVAGATISGLGAMPTSMGASVAPTTPPAVGRFLQHGSPAVGPNGELVMVWIDSSGGASANPRTEIYCDVDADGLGGAVSTFGTDLFVADSIMPGYREPSTRPLPQLERGYPLIPMPIVITTGANAGRIVVTWTGVDESVWPGTDDMNVLAAYSDSSGLSWSAPALVNTPSARHQFQPWLSADPVTGHVVCTFYDTRNDAGNQITQRFAVSSANGATWGSQLLLSQGTSDAVPGGGNDYLEYCGVAAYGRCIYTCWADNSNFTGDNPNGPGPGDGFDVYTSLFMQKP